MTNTIATCDACGQKNRVPDSPTAVGFRCGKCRADLDYDDDGNSLTGDDDDDDEGDE